MNQNTRTHVADRGHLLTEQPHPDSNQLDAVPLDQAFDLMNAEDARIAAAVADAKPEILAAVRLVADALAAGGRLFYVGAGTSGRLGVLDAAECPPTFLVDAELVQGIIAGGDAALRRSVEQAEDDPTAGERAIEERGIGAQDVVFGITAGGTTPFVHGALSAGRRRGAKTVLLACVPRDQAGDDADVSIRVLTGPEVLTGSTRLKAGIATKMVLNVVSTLSMTRLGKVYGNRMVDVNALGCSKLIDRAIRTLAQLSGLRREEAVALLERADWRVKTAVVMARRSCSRELALALLEAHGGHVRAALAATE